MKKRMHLAFDFSYIHMDGRWRMPGAWPGMTYPDVAMFEDMARIAERGKFDMLFSGDGTGVPSTWQGSRDAAVRWGISWPRQDLAPLSVAMARVTKHLGFGVTYSTTFMHPYYLARLFNSLDHVTGGRIAFNVITSTRRSDFANYGYEVLPDHDERYAPDGGVHRCLPHAVGQRRAGRDAVGPCQRPGRRPGQGARRRASRKILQGQRAAEHAALAAGAAAAVAGGRLGARHPRLRVCRRHGVRRRHAAEVADCAAQGAGRGGGGAGPRPAVRWASSGSNPPSLPRPSARRTPIASAC